MSEFLEGEPATLKLQTYLIAFISMLSVIGSVQTRAKGEGMLTQAVTYSGETITMRLTQENLRGAYFELWYKTVREAMMSLNR